MSIQIHYTVAIPHPETHRFHVSVEVTAWTLNRAEVVLPAWAPGSYLIREFSRHVEHFRAETLEGQPLAWARRDKGAWEIDTEKVSAFVVKYEVYANDLTVRTSHLDTSHGYFNGTNLFMYLDGFKQLPVTLAITPPAGWHTSIALPQNTDGRYEADTYDLLVDSPAEIGTHRVIPFEALGKPHEIAIWGHGNEDIPTLVQDFKQIVETVAHMFGDQLPYDYYLFIVHLGDKLGGGLEHYNSTTLMADRWIFQPAKEYEKFLRLTAHEFFHTWNVKRIRPSNLGPFDYTQEVYTPLLWVMEGFTTYYDTLLLRRGKFITPNRYLELLAERLSDYRQQPGRLIQSLEESSLTTWIKFYRKDENYINTGISYYLKGSLIALMLDLDLRTNSENDKTLDDVMRYLWHLYGARDVGFTPDEFYDVIEAVGEMDFDPYLNRFIQDVEELPLEDYFAKVGLELTAQRPEKSPTTWLGIRSTRSTHRLGVYLTNILRDSPSEAAGLMAKDHLIAIDGYRIPDSTFLTARLREKNPGDTITFHLFRHGQLLEKTVTLTAAPDTKFILQANKNATPAQRQSLEGWLETTWADVAGDDAENGAEESSEESEE